MKENVNGSVLIVGGGIAGMQSALDLANSGYYVYLLEKSPAIGGVMAQLDKTFPTNDCAMCIMSPILVEVGRHVNIELITYADLERVDGNPGNFHVTINKRAAYIDADLCTGCGECSQNCPVSLPDEYNLSLVDRKATYKQYAQAIPINYTIQKTDKAPCRLACPAGINVQGYVQMVGQGKYEEALSIIMEDLPLPGVLGRICPHGCEDACRRCEVDQPVAIRDLKRLAADQFDARNIEIPMAEKRDERVAIIGSGPAGLSAAYQLARRGIMSTIYEALPKAGGMLRVGIPDHRLPPEVLDQDIEIITNLGVEIKTDTPLGGDLTVDSLFDQGFKAVYLALGAHKGITLGVPGEQADGVRQGVDFLREVNLTGKAPVGKHVAIVGGGNVAIDVARSAVRLGAETVQIVYRRTRAEMPAWEEEIQAAETEGVSLTYLAAPQEILVTDGKVSSMRCIRMELGEPDSSGRRRPVPVPGSEYDLEIDQLIPAIGQRPDLSSIDEVEGLEFTRWSTTEVDPITYATGREGVFAGGDLQTGPWVAIGAIAAGKEAAESIARYLDGADMAAGREPIEREDPVYRPVPEGEPAKARAKVRELEPEARKGNFNEVELGLDEEAGKAEAQRCLNCGYCCECYQCVEACGAGAVTLETHRMQDRKIALDVGSVILSPGFTPYNPSGLDFYGYDKNPNVMTSIEFERILGASGPTTGHLVRLSDHKEPKKIAWLQCVGSRDQNRCDNAYCSSVCCMYAIKEAVIAKEHSAQPLDCAIFYMDMRTHGKDFERAYNDAKGKHGIRFVRSRVHTVDTVPGTQDVLVRYVLDDGQIAQEQFDMLILSVGLEISRDLVDLAERLDISLTPGKFCATSSFSPVATSRPGVFVCGAFQGPRDIPQSVVDASAAAVAAGELLSDAKFTLTKTKETVPQINVSGERPRVGVFVCHCGINIGGIVDVPAVRDYAATLPYVEYVADNLYTCSQDTQDIMTEIIAEKKLNRVVVAACTPKTHEPLFQETLINAGLNKYLFEFVNIRNHDSWVHRNNPDLATAKANDLVRMAIAKVALMEPLEEAELTIGQSAMVIGGGISGMAAALSLANQGYETHLVEQADRLGGQALNLFRTADGEDIGARLRQMVADVEQNNNIRVHYDSTLNKVDGFVGSFVSTLTAGDAQTTVDHGVTVIATGAQALVPSEYAYGSSPKILTSLELDRRFIEKDPALDAMGTAVFIQCVGSRETERPYCSRVCCTHSIDNALQLKERNPDMDVFILYRDIRTYGEREYLYKEAREKGIIFIRYQVDDKPVVNVDGDTVSVTVRDHVLGRPIEIETDLLTLATAIVPPNNEALAQFFKIPVNDDGFFVEKHAKLGPSDFATDGVFLCGLAHYPKPIDEAIAQGKAAASRATTLLAQKTINTSGQVAKTDPMLCSACGVCVSICPYSAPSFIDADARMHAGKAQINPVLCKGCGLCVAACRSGAIHLKGFDNDQIFAQIFEINAAV
ncbi:FAD-dependent oxidoreductase [uncultured Desulfosarcina sp.]|uniref:FAD-dependent oxidoreductase n=1 Tax=uncultured Desulfosarcina sp. TaxID=218289 RepID=UPI0029C75F59|nr:FAD-dependent oxidoreductase [uncultured Desulfosarcina sp.]